MIPGTMPAAGVRHRVLELADADDLARTILTGTYATVCAASRTRQQWTLAGIDGPDFRLLRNIGADWVQATGPADELATEFAGIPGGLETSTGTAPAVEPPPGDAGLPPLGPGDVLALAEVVRDGAEARIRAACDELELAGLPWWVREFTWGAEGALTLVLTVHDRPQLASMLHLLASGWGVLHAAEDDDLTFRPMSPLEVQARVSSFAALLVERSHAH